MCLNSGLMLSPAKDSEPAARVLFVIKGDWQLFMDMTEWVGTSLGFLRSSN